MIEVSKNYFLLYHARNSKDIAFVNFKELEEEEYALYSFILSVSKKYIAKMIHMDSFQALLAKLEHPPVSNILEIHPLQNSILALLANEDSSYNYARIIQDAEYLHKEEIINKVNYKKLFSLFHKAQTPARKLENDVDDNGFLKSKESFQKTIHNLSVLFLSNHDKTSLIEIQDYLLSQRFSIGITGVINAGKSTLINALLGKEILGNSMVPETANLTIIKEGEPSAKVSYWNKKEWEKISATSMNQMENSSLVEKYIHNESYEERIAIDEMREFTSATASKDAHYKLVKSVDLYQRAPFLSEGIEIVDTPGLDDPVILREEISKEYLSHCDAMIHLMNVNQSATQKDVEFIIDALLYQKISHLLVVLSHADTVSKTEMEEVIDYTKSSISLQLEALGKSSHLSFILQNIHFLPVSAKEALACRTGEACNDTMLEPTGILAIEEHLHRLLYGKDAFKAQLTLHKAQEKLRYFIEEQQAKDSYQLTLFSKNKEELEETLEEHRVKSHHVVNALRNDIDNLQQATSDYVGRLEVFLDEEFVDLGVLLTQRIFSDVQYTYQKSKKKPEENRIKIIISTTLKDGVLEIIRDYGYKLHKRCEQLIGGCQKRFEILKNSQLSFLQAEFERVFSEPFYKGFVTFSTEELTQDILKLIANSNPKSFDTLHVSLNETIAQRLDVGQIKVKAYEKSLERIEAFFQLFYGHIAHIEREEENEERMLLRSLAAFDDREDFLEDNISSLLSRKEQLGLVLERFDT